MVRGGGGGELGGSIHRLHTWNARVGIVHEADGLSAGGEGWLGDFTVYVSMPL